MKEKKKLANSKTKKVHLLSNNDDAFTLIELLAIIIILAIIAVITVPIILNVIDESKRGAATDSAYGYNRAVNQHYLTKLANDNDYELDGYYIIDENGALKHGNEEPIEINFSGKSPKGGSLVINDGSVEAGCITMSDYKVTMLDGNMYTTEKGNCNGIAVYFNVTTGEECKDNYQTSNSNNGKKAGCMKWYIYDVDGDTDTYTYTMLLDHFSNSILLSWIDREYYGSATVGESQNLGVTYKGNLLPTSLGDYANNRGPLKILEKLLSDTSEWKGTGIPKGYTVSDDQGNLIYKIDYSKYKARLISAEEIAKITGIDVEKGWTLSRVESITFSGYDWLIEGGSYWTSSLLPSPNHAAWFVQKTGSLSWSNVLDGYGIRPVITVSKSKF